MPPARRATRPTPCSTTTWSSSTPTTPRAPTLTPTSPAVLATTGPAGPVSNDDEILVPAVIADAMIPAAVIPAETTLYTPAALAITPPVGRASNEIFLLLLCYMVYSLSKPCWSSYSQSSAGELSYSNALSNARGVKVREHLSAVERCGPHVSISPAVLRSSNGRTPRREAHLRQQGRQGLRYKRTQE